jgi:hypothetical protein
LPGLGVLHLQPFPDAIFLPNVVIEIERVRGTVHGGYDFDLVQWDVETKVEAVQGVLNIIQELAAANLVLIKNLLHARRILDQAIELSNFPIRSFVDQLRIGAGCHCTQCRKAGGCLP